MTNRKSLVFVIPLIALVLLACRVGPVTINSQEVQGSGKVISEERQVFGYDQVALTGIGDLTIIQGDAEGLTIEADEAVMPYITSEVQGSKITLGLENGISLRNVGTIRYTLLVKDLNSLSISGSGNVQAEQLSTDTLKMAISGSGNVDIADLTADKLQLTISGSGDVDLAGAVDSQDVTISGSGNYQAGDLESSSAEVRVSGSGNVTLWAQDSLRVRISGFGDVKYYGQPQISETISGSGSVSSLGSK